MARSRNWVFTLNNYTDGDRARIGESLATQAVYVCYQPEIGESGTPHLQGLVVFANPRALGGVKRLISDRAHLEVMRGTFAEAHAYCCKEDTRDPGAGFNFTEHGTKPDNPGQGARTDLESIGKRLREGASLASIAEAHPSDFIRYHHGIRAMQALVQSQPRVRGPDGLFPRPRVLWFYGPAGSGKTRAIMDEIGDAPFFMKAPGNRWFDGFTGQKIVVFDDYRGDWWTYAYFLRILDCYPMDVEIKGGMVPFAATTIYISCPRRPEDVYAGIVALEDGSIQQLLRRITEVRLFGEEPVVAPRVAGFQPL